MKRTAGRLKKTLAVLLSALMVFTAAPLIANAAYGYVALEDTYLISDTERRIAPGVKENRIVTNKTSGQQQEMIYAVSVDPTAQVGLMAGYADYNGSRWKMQTVRDQAVAAHNTTGRNIVAAVNADIFNMSTGEPGGVLVMNGTVYKAGLGHPYFGVTKTGQIVLGESLTQSVLNTLQEAVSGFYMLVENGQRTPIAQRHEEYVAPHTAVGVKADGTVVIATVDGRNYPISCSCDNYDLATIMLGLGCVNVLNLDGGGSSTYLAKYEGKDYLELANNPSDAVERKVSSSLFVYSTALPSGVFDHASLEPNNTVYTPGSAVTFTATGVDSSGMSAELPAAGAFALDASSAALGDITSDGVFTSNGGVGTVTVNYVVDGEVKGSTSVEVRHPDEIYFSDEEVSLGFEEENDLGLVVKYQDRDMVIKAGDFLWSTTFNTPSEGDKFEYNGQKIIWHNGDFHYYSASGTSITYGDVLPESEREGFYATILGTFEGNVFTSAAANSVNGTVTATYVNDASVNASVNVIVGRLPVVAADFEGDLSIGRWAFDANGGMRKWESEPGDYDLVTGHYLNGDGTSRGGLESAETVDVDSGEPVRFGNQSLKINYDFRNINGIEGACVGFTQQSEPIPGNPTGIGLWLYNPEGGRNFWLRIRLLDGMNNILTLDFTKQKEGINWFGWKYVECDLTTHQGPFKLLGGETIRVMHTYGAYDGMGNYLAGTVTTAGPDANSVFLGQSTCVGSVYVDNLQFVYGANIDDIENPNIEEINVNNEALESGRTTVNTSGVSLTAYVKDEHPDPNKPGKLYKYDTGVDFDVLRIFVDGVNHTNDKYEDGTDKCVITEGDGRIDLYDLDLADGDHSVTVLVRDKFGNETTETRYFTVDTGNTSGIPGADVAAQTAPTLGTEFCLPLVVGAANVQSADATVKIDDAFKNFTVDFAEGFTGACSYNEFSKEITLHAEAVGGAAPQTGSSVAVATLKFPIDKATPKGTQFSYSVANGVFTLTDGREGSFAHAPEYIPVEATYELEASAAVVGYDTEITVTAADGVPAAGVGVFTADGASIGTTDANGRLVTSALTSSVAAYTVYAEKDGKYSFLYSSQSVAPAGNADGTPFSLMINAALDSETEKNVTWLSNPAVNAASAVVQYAPKAAYEASGEAAFITAAGKAELVDFLGSANVNNNYGAFLNTVVVSGLEKGTEYVYRAGDGTVFSPVYSFRTLRDGANTNFFIIGDTQTTDGELDNITAVQNQLANDGVSYDFGAQLGDFVEKGNMYADWQDILTAYDVPSLKTVDQIHVVGNHEAFGYALGTPVDQIFAKSLYNIPGGECWSAEYGSVYVAVINYTNNETVLQRCIDWLGTDAAKSACQWKILLTHQPAHGTNAASMDTDHFTRLLPPALEELGFDFMFSGHDHAYARTEPLTGGEVDNENGVVYFVCGSTGEKSYTATNNPAHHFAVCTQEYDHGIYLTVEATDREFTVTTKESNGDVLDTYTKRAKTPCVTDGHTFAYADGYNVCSVCGHAEPVDGYTGFAEDEATGRTRYFLNGEAQTGWLNYEEDVYYFDADGLGHVGDLRYEGRTYHMDEKGRQIGGCFVKENGYTRCYRGANYLTGWGEIDGKIYFFSTASGQEGKMLTGRATIRIYTGQEVTYTFASDGHLIEGAFVKEEGGTAYFWGQDRLLGWNEVKGKTYFFDYNTGYMYTGLREIDGKTYCFADDGVLFHEGDHDRSDLRETSATCTEDGVRSFYCSKCGKRVSEVIEPAKGHVDADGDEICDVCGESTKRPGFFDWIRRFFARIRAFFERIINFFRNL